MPKPTVESNNPRAAVSNPFTTDCPVTAETTLKPNKASKKYSAGPNCKANFAKSVDPKMSRIVARKLPVDEEKTWIPRAKLASPRSDKAKPSRIVAEDAGAARRQLDEMCAKLLANPVIEDYSVDLVDVGAR